jgi:hypothetical protein
MQSYTKTQRQTHELSTLRALRGFRTCYPKVWKPGIWKQQKQEGLSDLFLSLTPEAEHKRILQPSPDGDAYTWRKCAKDTVTQRRIWNKQVFPSPPSLLPLDHTPFYPTMLPHNCLFFIRLSIKYKSTQFPYVFVSSFLKTLVSHKTNTK